MVQYMLIYAYMLDTSNAIDLKTTCLQGRHGQDHPVKPVSDRGLLGRKV